MKGKASLLPALVRAMTTTSSAWIVGGAARADWTGEGDIDVIVPLAKWHRVAPFLPKESRPNSFGGWRFKVDGKEIDVWPDTLMRLASHPSSFQGAWHPSSGVRLVVTGAAEVTDFVVRQEGRELPEDGYNQHCENAMDHCLMAIAWAEKAGKNAKYEHAERHRLKHEGIKATIMPFCFMCGDYGVVGFGALCPECKEKEGG